MENQVNITSIDAIVKMVSIEKTTYFETSYKPPNSETQNGQPIISDPNVHVFITFDIWFYGRLFNKICSPTDLLRQSHLHRLLVTDKAKQIIGSITEIVFNVKTDDDRNTIHRYRKHHGEDSALELLSITSRFQHELTRDMRNNFNPEKH